jgi:hypothetical protein
MANHQQSRSEDAATQGSPRYASQQDLNDQLRPLQAQMAEMVTIMSQLSAKALQGSTESAAPAPGIINTPLETVSAGKPENLPSTIKRKPLPLPPKFSGKRSEFAAWKQQMIDKLQMDERFIFSQREAWYLINSCLAEQPQRNVAMFYAAGETMQYDPGQFINYLERNYSNQNLSFKATSSLRKLCQPDDQKFSIFLPKFERLIAEANGSDWPDLAKITFLEGALNEQLASRLVTATLPTDYAGWIAEVSRIASRAERFKSNFKTPVRYAPKGSRSQYAALPPEPSQDGEGDIAMGGVNKVKEKAAKKQRGRSRNRNYFICKSPKHLKADCPHKAAIKLARTQAAGDSQESSSKSVESSENE